MIKSQNKIFVICLVLLVGLSVGYAYFSENIKVTGTSKAAGTFKITTSCQSGLASYITNSPSMADFSEDYDQNNYSNDTCTVSDYGKTIKMNVRLKAEDALRLFSIKLTNSGTTDFLFPAYFEYEFLTSASLKAYYYDTDQLYTTISFNGTSSSWSNYKTWAKYYNQIAVEGLDLLLSDGTYFSTDEDKTMKYIGMTSDESEWVLVEPGASIVLVYSIWSSEENDDLYFVTDATAQFNLIQKPADFVSYADME